MIIVIYTSKGQQFQIKAYLSHDNNFVLKVVWNSHVNHSHPLGCKEYTCSFHFDRLLFFLSLKNVRICRIKGTLSSGRIASKGIPKIHVE